MQLYCNILCAQSTNPVLHYWKWILSTSGVMFWSENGAGSIHGSMIAFWALIADCFKMSNIESLLDISVFVVREGNWATRPLFLACPYGSCKLLFNGTWGKPACQALVQHLVAARDRLCRAGSERTGQPCPQAQGREPFWRRKKSCPSLYIRDHGAKMFCSVTLQNGILAMSSSLCPPAPQPGCLPPASHYQCLLNWVRLHRLCCLQILLSSLNAVNSACGQSHWVPVLSPY